MSLPLGVGEMSSARMKKREFATPTQTVATVAVKMASEVFNGNVARVLGWVRPVLSTAVFRGEG